MPKESKERVSRRQQLDPISNPEVTQTVARTTDQAIMPAMNPELAGLIKGLGTFNAALGEYSDERRAAASKQAVLDKKDGVRAGNIDLLGLTNHPSSQPDSPPQARSAAWEEGYKESLGAGMASKSQDEMLAQYKLESQKEDFDVESFITQFTQQEYAGITDPVMLGEIAKTHIDTIKQIRTSARDERVARLTESARANVSTAMTGSLTADKSAEELYTLFQGGMVPKMLSSGLFTRPEAADTFAEHLRVLSAQRGGAPELFDALTEFVDPTTKQSLANTNPELALKAETYRAAATEERDKRLKEGALHDNLTTRMGLEDRVARGDMVSDEEILENTGKFSVFSSASEAMAFRHLRDKEAAAVAERGANRDLIAAGQGWAIVKEEDRKAAFNDLTAAPVGAILGTLNNPEPQAKAVLSSAVRAIVSAHAKSGTHTPNTQLKNLIDGVTAAVPPKDGIPNAQFTLAAEIYQALPDNLKRLYFSEDATTLIGSYNSAREGRTDETTAYHQAYQSISPEAKLRAEAITKDPAFPSEVQSMVSGLTLNGFEWLWRSAADILPFAEFTPTNEDGVAISAQLEAKRFLLRNPEATEARLESHLKGWYQDRYIHDTTTNTIIGVPPGQASDGTRAAISAYTESLEAKYGKSAEPTLVYMGNGKYQARAQNPNKLLSSDISLRDIVAQHAEATTLTESDRARLSAIKLKLNAGTATVADIAAEDSVLAKGRALGLLNKEFQLQMDNARAKAFSDKLGAVQKMSMGDQTFDSLDGSRLPANRSKSRIALTLINHGDLGGALTTMAEGVALTAYPDPATGTNIGIGYNMEANAATIKEDFRRAGIPAKSVEAIRAGKLSITEDQAMRLYGVTRKRLDASTKETVESMYPGMWDRLPKNQRAVLSDVAYQVGSVSKFTKALKALFTGDAEAVAAELEVSYKRKSDGKMVKDRARNNMRAHMLNSPSAFRTLIGETAKKPRNLIEAKKDVMAAS